MSASSKSSIESIFESRAHQREAFNVLYEMKGDTELCDVTLRVGNIKLAAHRTVLAATSPFFRQEFSSTGVDNASSDFVLPDHIQPASMAAMLDFLYTGNLHINAKNTDDLLTTASLLKNDEAIQALVESSISNLKYSNCFRLQDIARKNNFVEMKEKVDRFVAWHFEHLSTQRTFLSLDAKHLREILRSDKLRVTQEELIYEAVLMWYLHDREQRREFAELLFAEVHFCQIPEEVLISKVMPNLVEKETLCSKQIEKAMDYHRDPANYPSRPRKPLESIYVISRKDSIAEQYDPIHGTCEPCYSMVPLDEQDGDYRCALKVGGDLYTVFESRVERYDPVGLCWQGVGQGMDTRDSGVCAGKNCIYVVGGRFNGDSAHKYSIKNGTWTALPNMAESRRIPGAALIGPKLYVIGGYSGKSPLSSVEMYHTKQEKWSSLKPLHLARFQFGVVTVDNCIYVLGGRDNSETLNSIELYDPKAKSWKILDGALNEARNDFGAVAHGNAIFCFGGRGVKSIESFDTESRIAKVVGSVGISNFSIDCVVFPSM